MRKNVNQLKIGIVLSYLSSFVQLLIGLTYTPLMIRLLGQSEYGLYNIAASTIAYLGVLNFGFGSAYMRFYSRYKVSEDTEKISILNGMFLTIFSILGIIAVGAGIVLAQNVGTIFGTSLSVQELSTARLLILILVVNLAISFPVIVFNTFLQANEKFVFQNTLQIIRQITTPLITLPVLIAGYGSIGMVISSVLINITIEIIIILYTINKMEMKFSIKNYDKNLMSEMVVYSSFIFINMIVDQVNNNMDKTILGRYQGTISVAIYSVAANLNVMYTQISTAVSNVFIPRIHRMVAGSESDTELTQLFTRIGRIQFILLSLVYTGFVFFGRPFIGLWAGEDYYDSYLIAVLLMGSIFVPLIQNIGIEIQRAKNMHQFRSWVYIIIALINFLVSIPLSQKYGGVGAAMGTAVSMIIGNWIVMNWHYHKKIGLDMKFYWKEIFKFFPALLISFIYGVLVNKNIDLYKIQNLLFFGFMYIIIYMVSMWVLGMNETEKKLITNPLS